MVLLAVLSGFYIWNSNRDVFHSKDNEKDAANEASQIIASLDSEFIDRIHFKNANADMTLVLEDNIWVSLDDKLRPIKQNYVQNMVRLVSVVKTSRTVDENPENLKQYGLSSPYTYIEASQSDGKKIALSIGNKLANGQGCYAKLDGDTAVYILSTEYANKLSYSDINMTDVEHGPNITTEDIYHLELLREDGEDFELIYDPDSIYIDIPLISWAILKPYDEVYGADSTKALELLSNYSSFRFEQCIEYKADDIGKYGLDKPKASILVEYNKQNPGEDIIQNSFKLYIGDQDDNGDSYVMKDGDSAVYTMKKYYIDNMTNIDPFSVLNTFVSIHNISSVDKIDVNIEGTSYIMEIKRGYITNDEGEQETHSTYYFNGVITEERVFKDLYQLIAGAKIDSQLNKDISVSDDEPLLTISYYITDSEQPITSKYYVYDDVFYLIDKGNKIRFVADKRRIDKIMDAFREYVLE